MSATRNEKDAPARELLGTRLLHSGATEADGPPLSNRPLSSTKGRYEYTRIPGARIRICKYPAPTLSQTIDAWPAGLEEVKYCAV
ncbi:hypothetical protein MRX96_004845 [Rhipicephalus microplus]